MHSPTLLTSAVYLIASRHKVQTVSGGSCSAQKPVQSNDLNLHSSPLHSACHTALSHFRTSAP